MIGIVRRRLRLGAAPLLAAALLCSCSIGSPVSAGRDVARSSDSPIATATPMPTPLPTPVPLRVAALPFHEPLDHAHRNYCGPGATEVLLSAWEAHPPDVETVARALHLDPNSGTTGAATVAGINALLVQVVVPVTGHDWYRGEHVTALAGLVDHLRADLGSSEALGAFGHTVPVMVQTMTRTMPGWSGWQATHMITIVAADLGSGDPAVDTVTYAETPSPIAGYRGPDFQTITLGALWTAMRAFLADDPADPVNIIW